MKILSATDSVFVRVAASSADDFFDELYGDGSGRMSRDGEWEEVPGQSHIYDDIGVSGRYRVTPEEHKMLHHWRGPNGEKIEYMPETTDFEHNTARDTEYRVEHRLPNGTMRTNTFHPPSTYDHPDADFGRTKWTHGYHLYDLVNHKYIEGNWHGESPEYGNNGDLKEMLDKAYRLNSGEPLRTVYPVTPRDPE